MPLSITLINALICLLLGTTFYLQVEKKTLSQNYYCDTCDWCIWSWLSQNGYYDGCFKIGTGVSVTFLHFPSDTLRLKMSQLSQDFDTSAFGRRFIFPILQSPDFQLSHCAIGPSSLIWLVHYNSFYLLCIVSIIAFCIFSIDIFIQSSDVPLPHCCVLPPHLPLFDFCCWLVHYNSFYVSFASGSFEELYC